MLAALVASKHVSKQTFLCYVVVVVVAVVVYPTPSKGWGHGGRPWSPRCYLVVIMTIVNDLVTEHDDLSEQKLLVSFVYIGI